MDIAPTVHLSDEDVAFYHREGYLVIRRVSPPDELAWMRELYDDLFARRAGREAGNQFDLAGTDEDGKPARLPQILGPSGYAPQFRQSYYFANATAIARQLLGSDCDFRGDHAILKPASDGAPTPWHQDEAYWSPDLEYHSMSFWMPLQPATRENGCMCFIPRSHRLEVQPHHCINQDPRIHGLEVDQVDDAAMVYCPLDPGDATLHHSRTLHYAPPNTTSEVRRAYILGFGLPARPRAEPRNFYWNAAKRTARQERAKAAARAAAAKASSTTVVHMPKEPGV